MEKSFKEYLDRVLAGMPKDPVDSEGYDALVEKPECPGPDVSGAVNTAQDELCLDDLVCEFKPKYLKDHLPVFADAAEIIKMNKIFKDKPELRDAERSDSKGGCDGCKADSGCAGKEGQE